MRTQSAYPRAHGHQRRPGDRSSPGPSSVICVSATSRSALKLISSGALVGGFPRTFRLCALRNLLVIYDEDSIKLLPTLRRSSDSEALTNVIIGSQCKSQSTSHGNACAWITNAVPNFAECNTTENDFVFRLFLPIANFAARRFMFGCGLIARTPSSTTHLRIHSADSCFPTLARKRFQSSSLSTAI